MQSDVLTIAKRGTEFRHAHARKCNGRVKIKLINHYTGEETKVEVPCKVCIDNLAWFNQLPPDILSLCLQEPYTTEARFSLASLIVESTFERGTHKGKRARRDLICGMHLLKFWQDELGGKLPRSN